MIWYVSCKYMGNWQMSVRQLHIVTRHRRVSFLNLINYLVVLLDNLGLRLLSQVYISLGRLPSVPVPLNLFLACCFFLFIWNIKLRRNICFYSVTETAPISFFVFSGICWIWHLFFFRFVFTGHQVLMQEPLPCLGRLPADKLQLVKIGLVS